MYQEFDLILPPSQAFNPDELQVILSSKAGVNVSRIRAVRILNRSVDARQRNIKVNIKAGIFIDEEAPLRDKIPFNQNNVSKSAPVIIIGSGPAGLFAALQLIEKKIKPVILERGKEVGERKKDVAKISTEHIVDPESNYCFGEGGAGTFSDGKLYSRSKKRGDIAKVFEWFYHFGADESVLYDAHPHIGTERLPEIIKKIRQYIIDCGGEIHFNARVFDLLIHDNAITGVKCSNGETIKAKAVILATGHSARDMYELLQKKNIQIESKDFAVGVRIEHPQPLIDSIRYHSNTKDPWLPAASYALAEQVNGRGVYSFCMCPGGFIVPSATMPDEIVVNGMSPSQRNSPFANSAIVAEVKAADLIKFEQHDSLKGMIFQRNLEMLAHKMSGSGQKAPAQRLVDFLNGKNSSALPKSSYFPGTVSSPLHEWLPVFVSDSLKKGFLLFEKKMKGFITGEAVILGVETRTSSPVRIPRNPETFQHVQVKGLYPCGEGSGYAGGIASSALDGIAAALKLTELFRR